MTSDKNVSDEQALQNLLLDINCLNELLPWTEKFNLFDVLKISRAEIRHSNMLAWLLDANENHGLGDEFFKGVVQRLIENNSESKYNVFKVLLLDFFSFSVYREWKGIDLLLVSDTEKTLIAIENKVGSHEHSDQLNRYRETLSEIYPKYTQILVFLTPEGEAPSDSENWDTLTYTDVVEVLEDIYRHNELAPDVDLIIRNYMEVIRRDIVDDQQLIDICNKIYNKHKKAFDLIYDNRTDIRHRIIGYVRETMQKLSDDGKIICSENTSGKWVCFYTQVMKELLPDLQEANSSWGTNKIYCYWLDCNESGFYAAFELGGWNVPDAQKETVLKIINAVKPNDKNKDSFRYKRLYSKNYEIEDMDDLEQSVRCKVEAAVNDMLSWQGKLIKKIENV